MSYETVKLLTSETLREYYVDQGWSMTQVADHFNVSLLTVQSALVTHGIEIRNRREPDPTQVLLQDQLVDCYVNKGMSITAIANQFNMTYAPVRVMLKNRLGKLKKRAVYTPKAESGLKYLYAQYKHSALERNHTFELDFEQFQDLTQQDCYYCGIAPSQYTWGYTYNGIDRIDNTKGYIPGNVRPCCGPCNKAKSSMTEQEFFEWLKRIAAHRAWERKR